MKNLFVFAFFLIGTTSLSAQVELDLETFEPTTYELDGRCFYVGGQYHNLKALRNLDKTKISRVLEATAEEAPLLLEAYGEDPYETDCSQGLLWIEMQEN
ncbi:MAG: hypothetical protein AAFQ01_03630 [Bacteroidota bacterium]